MIYFIQKGFVLKITPTLKLLTKFKSLLIFIDFRLDRYIAIWYTVYRVKKRTLTTK